MKVVLTNDLSTINRRTDQRGYTADSDNKISEAAARRPSGMTKLGSHFPPFSQSERRPEGMTTRRIS